MRNNSIESKSLHAKKRNENIELLRVIAMLFIIIHHCTINGYGLQQRLKESIGGGGYSAFLCLINCFAVIGVNLFFLISGYFGIKPSRKRLLHLIIELYVYADLLTLLSVLLGMESFDFATIKLLILPFYRYWFVIVYLMLYIAAPLINHGTEALGETSSKQLLLVLTAAFCGLGFVSEAKWFGLNNGYSLMFAFYLYYVGRVMSRWDLSRFRFRFYTFLWLASTLSTACACFILIKLGRWTLAWRMFSYNQPFVAVSSVLFLCMFLRMKKREYGTCVHRLARTTLPVYYLHTCTVFSHYRNIPLKYIAANNWNYLLQTLFLLVYACLIYIAGTLIDEIMRRLISYIEEKITNITTKKAI